MIRVKNSPQTRFRHKKILSMAEGYRGRAKSCFRIGIEKIEKALQYQYAHRKTKKRILRTTWIQRINAGCLLYGITYSNTIKNLTNNNIILNRKMLSELAIVEPQTFRTIVQLHTIFPK